MAKGIKKRLAAAVLSAVLAATAVSVMDGRSVTQAASKQEVYVSLRTSFKTLKVNETNKMTLKNNTVGWKITKIATDDRNIAMVYQKTDSDFMIKGKSAGRTKVKARLKAPRKKYNSKLVKCTVNVIAENQPVTAIETEKSVATQAELDAALADGNLNQITIDTKEKQKFVINKGDYPNTALVVKAPESEVENEAKFKSVDIQQIAADTWYENASGNVLRVSASSARIVVGPGGQIRSISFTGTDANVKLVVNGSVENVTVSAKMKIDISSDLSEKPMVPVTIDAAAQGVEVTAQTPLDVKVNAADTVLNFQKGSEGSKVKAETKTTVNNNSNGTVYVTNANNITQQVLAGRSSVFNANAASNPSSGGSSGSGSYGPSSVVYYTVSFEGREVRVQSGEKVKESDIPHMVKRNGDGYKFSGWYYADGTDDNGNVKYIKFDLDTAITRNLELYPRWGMTAEDRILDVRGKLTVTSGSALKADLSRSNVTVAIGDNDTAEAGFVRINDTVIAGQTGEVEVSLKDGKLEIVIQVKNTISHVRFRTEVTLPAESQDSAEINLAECEWAYFAGDERQAYDQESLNAALADGSCGIIYIQSNITTPSALKLVIPKTDRQDVKLFVNEPEAEIENNAVFQAVYIQAENIKWTEKASGNSLYVIFWTSSVTVAENAEVRTAAFNWGGDGNLIVNGKVGSIEAWNDRNADDTKSINITISGTSAANIPLIVYRRDTTVTASIPLDVVIEETAPRTVIDFQPGAGNSTVAANVQADILNNSGQEIIIKDTGN